MSKCPVFAAICANSCKGDSNRCNHKCSEVVQAPGCTICGETHHRKVWLIIEGIIYWFCSAECRDKVAKKEDNNGVCFTASP